MSFIFCHSIPDITKTSLPGPFLLLPVQPFEYFFLRCSFLGGLHVFASFSSALLVVGVVYYSMLNIIVSLPLPFVLS